MKSVRTLKSGRFFQVKTGPDRRRILRLLQQDGRLSNAGLASQDNVSAATCHRRTQLFEEGYVRSVRALVDPLGVDRG